MSPGVDLSSLAIGFELLLVSSGIGAVVLFVVVGVVVLVCTGVLS